MASKFGKLYARKKRQECLTFTIDGKGTQIIDDAVTVEQIDDETLRVGVHISDPTEAVVKGSAIDKEA